MAGQPSILKNVKEYFFRSPFEQNQQKGEMEEKGEKERIANRQKRKMQDGQVPASQGCRL